MTSQPLQHSHNTGKGEFVKKTVIPCSHGGVHGDTIRYDHSYYPNYAGNVFADQPESTVWAQKLRTKIEADTVNIGTALAEYRATAKMFGDVTKQIVDVWNILKGRRVRRKIKACSVPAAYLQYTYGIGPLVGDLYDSVEVLRLKLERGLLIKRAFVRDSEKLRRVKYVGDLKQVFQGTRSYHATFQYRLDPKRVQAITYGNPAEWIWETIPFSFVVDGVIPIGEYIASLDSLFAVAEIHGVVTTKTDWQSTVIAHGDSVTIEPANGFYKSHKRDSYDSVPMSPFPKYSPSQSYKKVLNNLVLLWGINKRCKR
jgi:hypothetical protein